MSLMSDLTDIIVEESKPEPELPEASEGQNIEEQLLDLEAHLDTSMHKMRRNLMIIRLLGLLSEDQDLQDNLLKESNRYNMIYKTCRYNFSVLLLLLFKILRNPNI